MVVRSIRILDCKRVWPSRGDRCQEEGEGFTLGASSRTES